MTAERCESYDVAKIPGAIERSKIATGHLSENSEGGFERSLSWVSGLGLAQITRRKKSKSQGIEEIEQPDL
jgi:hypothetical protein